MTSKRWINFNRVINQEIINKYTILMLDGEPVKSMVHLEAMMFMAGNAIPELGKALRQNDVEFTNLFPKND